LAQEIDFAAAQAFLLRTYRFYDLLMQNAPASPGDEPRSLGGCLFWAGEMDAEGRALIVAGNIAGAATLATVSDPDVQRRAVRDGVADFFVNSLDEALRILKNEVRKRETVAVCVAAPIEAVEHEMAERGVLPDVLRQEVTCAPEPVGMRAGASGPEATPRALVTWRVDRAPALWLPKLDALALECLTPDEIVASRWLQRSSRYLGRLGQVEHLVWSSREFAARMMQRVGALARDGELMVPGRVEASWAAGNDQLYFGPAGDGSAAPQP
jgi:hypothetical protein